MIGGVRKFCINETTT